jgi:hypothetical protein
MVKKAGWGDKKIKKNQDSNLETLIEWKRMNGLRRQKSQVWRFSLNVKKEATKG